MKTFNDYLEMAAHLPIMRKVMEVLKDECNQILKNYDVRFNELSTSASGKRWTGVGNGKNSVETVLKLVAGFDSKDDRDNALLELKKEFNVGNGFSDYQNYKINFESVTGGKYSESGLTDGTPGILLEVAGKAKAARGVYP